MVGVGVGETVGPRGSSDGVESVRKEGAAVLVRFVHI